MLQGEPLPLTSEVEERAYIYWRAYHYPFCEKEDEVLPFMKLAPTIPDVLKITREMMFLSQESVARKAGMSRQAYARLEHAEQEGNITLRKMREIATALECDLVYKFRPKERFSRTIFARILPEAVRMRSVHAKTGDRLPRFVAYYVGRFMRDAKFRAKQGWIIADTELQSR